jgi:hypothetical protein
LKEVHANTEKTKAQICAAGPAGGSGPPSISDALGVYQMTAPDRSKGVGGSDVFGTLTGNAVK